MKLRRKSNIGLHRVNVPGHGWATVKPGEQLPGDHETIGFLGSQADNYIVTEGVLPPKKEEEPEPDEPFRLLALKIKGTENYNVVNSVSGKNVNDHPFTKKQTKQFLEVTDGECPLGDGNFGKDYDKFEECDGCIIKEDCKKAK